MPFRGVSVEEQRASFVGLATAEGANVRGLCRRFGISPTTGYKWLKRSAASGAAGLRDGSRRPRHSPCATAEAVVQQVLLVRRAHPAWGGRKIRFHLEQRGVSGVPHINTITDILRRHGLIAPAESAKRRRFERFEAPAPNDLWQMDFKGHFAVGGQRCHPLSVIDDHSRYAVALGACADERREGVQHWLTMAFRRYGLPRRILSDNGPPWGKDAVHRHTRLTAWLMRLDITPIHGRPYHPQTQGKCERFNGTLKRELLAWRDFGSLEAAQLGFDDWRQVYNHQRPHQAIGDQPPASRYRVAEPRAFPERLPALHYPAGLALRRVQEDGRIVYAHRGVFLSQAFARQTVALRPTEQDGIFDILFARFVVARLDLTQPG